MQNSNIIMGGIKTKTLLPSCELTCVSRRPHIFLRAPSERNSEGAPSESKSEGALRTQFWGCTLRIQVWGRPQNATLRVHPQNPSLRASSECNSEGAPSECKSEGALRTRFWGCTLTLWMWECSLHSNEFRGHPQNAVSKTKCRGNKCGNKLRQSWAKLRQTNASWNWGCLHFWEGPYFWGSLHKACLLVCQSVCPPKIIKEKNYKRNYKTLQNYCKNFQGSYYDITKCYKNLQNE